MDEYGNSSPVVTKTFFVDSKRFQNGAVVSIVADPIDLFDDEKGIYVTGIEYDTWYSEYLGGKTATEAPTLNYERKGEAWEREAFVSFFDLGEEILSQNAGIRIQGHGSRQSALKRFSIFAREQYNGSPYFETTLFGDHKAHAYVLRRGDLNALAQSIAADRDVLTMPYKKATVFLNGEYWYNTYLLEKANSTLIANQFGVSEANVAIVKNGVQTGEAKKGENPFSLIFSFARKKDMTNSETYRKFSEIIDIQSFIDASCVQIYFANVDSDCYTENGQSGGRVYSSQHNYTGFEQRKLGRELLHGLSGKSNSRAVSRICVFTLDD